MSTGVQRYLTAWSALPANVRGPIWATAGAVSFTAMGAIVRVLSGHVSVETIILFRNALSLPVLALWMVAAGRTANFKTTLVWMHLLRAVSGVASLACLIVAYQHLNFALATALAYTTPIWVIVLSMIFIGERPGWQRLLATVLGFVGVLVIVRPLPVWEIGVWSALASAVFGATALSFLRHLIRLEPTETLLFYFFLFGIIISAGPAMIWGVFPTVGDLALLAAVSLFGMAGLGFAANAFGVADATVVAPFDFLRLPLASAIGIIVFAEVPDMCLLLGSSIMVIALYAIIALGPRL
jgi:drug/metabolite transporter (DMT)-like permease